MLRYAVLFVAGCNQVYGLDPTHLPPAFPVTGTLLQRWVENDANGNPEVHDAPLSQTNDVYLSVRVDDAVTDLDIDAAGGFTFMRSAEDEPYVLTLTTDGEVSELQHDARQVRYMLRTAGRFDAARVADTLAITFPQTFGTTGVIASTGIWANAADGFPIGGYHFDWQKAVAGSSRHGLLDSKRQDVLYAYELGGRTSPEGFGYQTIVSASRSDIVMADLVPPIALPAPAMVTPMPCSKLTGPIDREFKRLSPVQKQFIREYESWAIAAVPNLDAATAGATVIASGVQLGMEQKFNVTPSIHNPIAGSSLTVLGATSMYRLMYHPDSAGGVFLRAALSFIMPLTCVPGTVIVPEEQIGIPGNPRLEGLAIDIDGVDVPTPEDRTADLELTWDIVAPGHVDYSVITLFEVRDVGNQTTMQFVRAIQTPYSRSSISRAGLTRGRYYMFQITAVSGFPGAATGDIATFTLPFSAAQTYSAMFRLR